MLTHQRIRFAKDLPGPTLAALCLAAPLALLLIVGGQSQSLAEVEAASGVVTYALVLGAAVFAYCHWRLSEGLLENRLAGWLTTALTICAVNGLVLHAPLGPVGQAADADRWPLVSQLLLVVLIGALSLVAEHVDVPGNPALLGVVIGLVLSAACLTMSVTAEPLLLGPALAGLLNSVVLIGGLAVAWVVLQVRSASPWMKRRLVVAATALTAAECVAYGLSDRAALVGLIVALHLTGATVLWTMAHALLRRSIRQQRLQLSSAHAAIEQARADVRFDKEVRHEVGSIIAGVASASRLMRDGQRLTEEQRKRLGEMLEAELARLERLMSHHAPESSREVDVDRVAERIVMSHQVRGLEVRWTPSGGAIGTGDPDDLAEVVNILLENAFRHGHGRAVDLEVRAAGGFVEVVCADGGPGVDPAVRDRLFSPGAHGPASPGQGLGLAIAYRLMTSRGGTLELVENGPGATFLARLPREVSADVLRYATV